MSDRIERTAGISRRDLAALGLTAGAAAAAAIGLPGTVAAAAFPSGFAPEAFSSLSSGLTYLGVDAFAFFPDDDTSSTRYYADNTGEGAVTANRRLSAALPLPAGSTIYELHIAYQGQPIVEIWKRNLVTPVPYSPAFQQTVPAGGGGPATATLKLPTPITVGQFETLSLRFYDVAGDTVIGMIVGYLPPTQGFVPFSGSAPRALDTRNTGGKLNPNEERTIDLGFAGARAAVINLTVTGTEGVGGFVAVFSPDIAYPGNSSINWSSPNENIANGVITAMNAAGQIKIRGGANRTDVVIDRIGWLI